jgi:hypothetical protein
MCLGESTYTMGDNALRMSEFDHLAEESPELRGASSASRRLPEACRW